MTGIFSNFKSEKPVGNVLSAGTHIVKLIKVFLIDSFTNLNGSLKENSPWSVPTEQVGVQVGNDKGVITERLNGLGYVHTEDVDPDEMEKAGLVDHDGYVCKELENGKLERIQSDINTEACKNILNRFFWACSVPEGTTLDQLMVLAKDNDITLEVKVEVEEYDGKKFNVIKSFSQVKAKAETAPEMDLK